MIEVGPVQDSWAKRNNAKLAARQKAAEALIQNDSLVQELKAQWGAKIVPGSVKAPEQVAQIKAQLINPFSYLTQRIPMFNKGQLSGLMKQAQAMQDNLKKAQDDLANIEVTAESGAGLVKVTMTCKHDVKRIEIDPSLLGDDKDMLEDLVAAAFNAAVRKAEETSQRKNGQDHAPACPASGGMKFPF